MVFNGEDLLIFHKALLERKLFSKEIYPGLYGKNKFLEEIIHGTGGMAVKFGNIFS